MAAIYKATCKDCSNIKSILWGDGMFYIQFQCSKCFKTFSIPRHAPRPKREGREVPKFLETISFQSYPPTAFEEIIRFSDAELQEFLASKVSWQNGDDDWDQFEIEKIFELIGCGCHSAVERVSRDKMPKSKCDSCGSTNFQFDLEKMAD